MNIIEKTYAHYDYLYRKRCAHEQLLNQYIDMESKILKRLTQEKNWKYFQRVCILETGMIITNGNNYDILLDHIEQLNYEIEMHQLKLEEITLLLEKNCIHKVELQKLLIAWQRKIPETIRKMWQQYQPQQEFQPYEQLQIQYKKEYQKQIHNLPSGGRVK